MGFSDKLLQSAARTPCAPMAHKAHTCGLRSIFCQVHAPAENDLILFADYRRQTLRGFFNRLKSQGLPPWLFLPEILIQNESFRCIRGFSQKKG